MDAIPMEKQFLEGVFTEFLILVVMMKKVGLEMNGLFQYGFQIEAYSQDTLKISYFMKQPTLIHLSSFKSVKNQVVKVIEA